MEWKIVCYTGTVIQTFYCRCLHNIQKISQQFKALFHKRTNLVTIFFSVFEAVLCTLLEALTFRQHCKHSLLCFLRTLYTILNLLPVKLADQYYMFLAVHIPSFLAIDSSPLLNSFSPFQYHFQVYQ